MTVLDVLGSVVAVGGALLVVLAAVGLHRFDDPDVRLHVAAKASSAGVLLVLLGLGLRSADLGVALELGLTGVFLLITVPIATHALAQARHGDGSDDR